MGDVQHRDRSLIGTPTATHVGSYSNIVISVSDGKASAALAPFSITVAAMPNKRADDQRHAGDAASTRAAHYAFRPTAADADGDTLTFSIANRPAWATFNAATGQLSGTPAATSAGTYSNIVISVSDGKASAALAAFSITVVDVSNGAASLTWTPPTQNTDGSTLTNLAGYRIVYGTSAAQLTQTIQVANAGMSSYVVDNLAPGTYYFAVRAYTSSGAESADSNVVAKSRAVASSAKQRMNLATRRAYVNRYCYVDCARIAAAVGLRRQLQRGVHCCLLNVGYSRAKPSKDGDAKPPVRSAERRIAGLPAGASRVCARHQPSFCHRRSRLRLCSLA